MDAPCTPQKSPSQVLRYAGHALDAVFTPKTVAVIGASERAGTVGRTIIWNLVSSPFGGTVFPVNPKRSSVLGVRAYPTIADVPERIDLAVIVTPAATTPALVRECANAGVKAAIVTAAGFKETGADGLELERALVRAVRGGSMRLVGPNCLGVMSPATGLNATLAAAMARPGSVGFISQSGALCTAVLDWSLRMNVGFSHFVSIGSMADVGWGDVIDYLGDDPRTKSIVIYMESIGDARGFLSAAREVALTKPIIVIKAGRTIEAARAAASHTGVLTGSDDVFDAAFRRSGVLRVNSIAELFYMAEVLGAQPRPKGPRLTIVTNAGGPGVLATDALIQNRGELAPIGGEAMQAYNALLPREWSHNNPIDVAGDADATRYGRTVEVALKDDNSDGLLVVLAPQALTDPTKTAEQLARCAAGSDKPVLASWMGGAQVAAGEAILAGAHIPAFPYPDTAARVFALMWQYSYNLRGLYERPALPLRFHQGTPVRERVEAFIEEVRAAGRTILTEAESKHVLAEYGIPVVETHVAASAAAAVRVAATIGYPVVLKLESRTLTHKSDVGGVQLNLGDEAAVRRAYDAIRTAATAHAGAAAFHGVTVQPMVGLDGYEVIIGSSLDPQFGPVLLFGSGGRLVEVHKDRALALPPLNTTLARRMMEQTRIYRALRDARGRPAVDLGALEDLMVRFSSLVAEQPWIQEIDVNPLLVSAGHIVALDARMVLHPLEMTADRRPALAVRPYPLQYVRESQLNDGTMVTIRPIRPEDEPAMVTFHEGLSERSVYFRYFHMVNLTERVAHERLTRICFIDYDREMALVAEQHDAATGEGRIVAVGRLTRIHATREAEFAVLVTDAFQGRGLGTLLVGHLLEVAKAEGVARVVGDMLSDNREMQHICERHGFTITYEDQTQMLRAARTM
jgi:acetyltransferase